MLCWLGPSKAKDILVAAYPAMPEFCLLLYSGITVSTIFLSRLMVDTCNLLTILNTLHG